MTTSAIHVHPQSFRGMTIALHTESRRESQAILQNLVLSLAKPRRGGGGNAQDLGPHTGHQRAPCQFWLPPTRRYLFPAHADGAYPPTKNGIWTRFDI